MLETAWRSLCGLDRAARERALVYLAQRLLPDTPPPTPNAGQPRLPAKQPLPYSANLDAIVEAVAGASGVSAAAIKGARRTADVCRARFAAMFLMQEGGAVLAAIGRALGGRDHTTIIHGQRKAAALRQTDPDFAALVARAAQAIEARRAETQSGSVHESAVPAGDAPTPPTEQHTPASEIAGAVEGEG